MGVGVVVRELSNILSKYFIQYYIIIYYFQVYVFFGIVFTRLSRNCYDKSVINDDNRHLTPNPLKGEGIMMRMQIVIFFSINV